MRLVSSRAKAAFTALAGISAVHLVAQGTAPGGVVAEVSQILLMPAVAAVLLAGVRTPRSRTVKLAGLALFFSWLGDTLPRFGEGSALVELYSFDGFLLMVGGFLAAQIAYCAAFARHRRDSWAVRPVALGAAGALLVAVLAVIAPAAGGLLAPVAVYAVSLLAMALLATGLGPKAALGGLVFVASDALIGLRAFAGIDALERPAWGVVVMATYIVGQTLLTLGVLDRDAERAEAGLSRTTSAASR